MFPTGESHRQRPVGCSPWGPKGLDAAKAGTWIRAVPTLLSQFFPSLPCCPVAADDHSSSDALGCDVHTPSPLAFPELGQFCKLGEGSRRLPSAGIGQRAQHDCGLGRTRACFSLMQSPVVAVAHRAWWLMTPPTLVSTSVGGLCSMLLAQSSPTSSEDREPGRTALSEAFWGRCRSHHTSLVQSCHAATTCCPRSQELPQPASCGRVDSSLRPRQDAASSTGAPGLRAWLPCLWSGSPSPGTCPLRSVANSQAPWSQAAVPRPGAQDPSALAVHQRPLGCDSVAPRYQALQGAPWPLARTMLGVAGFPEQRPAGAPTLGRGEVGHRGRACQGLPQWHSDGGPWAPELGGTVTGSWGR